jgi:3,4-dihydroxy 2-butanone 4-phosphate synthase/GTP cyclohydrolase II
MPASPIPEILAELKAGRMIVLVDDPSRENEGDLAMLAEHVTPAAINFMAREARGLICLPLAGEVCDRLRLLPQVDRNRSRMGTAFTVSIEAARGVTTGISAADRSHTIRMACDPASGPEDVVSPGHVFPLRARDGGVLVREGQTEGIVDLARLAGAKSAAGVICEIMNEDGTMARMPELEAFAARHGLMVCTISDLIAYRRRHDNLVRQTAERQVTSEFGGDWSLRVFTDEAAGAEHLVLTKGDIARGGPVLVRMHAMNPLTDLLALDPGKAHHLQDAMRLIGEEGRGVIVLLRDMSARLNLDGAASPQTLRQYGLGAQILGALGVQDMVLLSNSPSPKVIGLEGYGLSIHSTRPIPHKGA